MTARVGFFFTEVEVPTERENTEDSENEDNFQF